MGFRRFFQRNAAQDIPTLSSPEPQTTANGPELGDLTPEQLVELTVAWGELSDAATAAGVTRLQTCTRNGAPWETDPVSVRALAATLRKVKDEEDTRT